MFESGDITKETEELSRLLDEMNSGRQPESGDEELAALLAVAALLKKAGPPVRPPQHLLDQTVNRALAGRPASGPKRFRAWAYSGALGAVASVLLLVVLNMMPSWPREAPVLPSPDIIAETRQPVPGKPDENQAPPAPLPAADSVKTEARRPESANANNTPPTADKPAAPVTAAVPTPAGRQSPQADAEKSFSILTEQAGTPKAAFLRPKAPGAKANTAALATAPLSLPGRVPDLIAVDTESGLVRQVFAKDTPQEIIVTQRPRPAADDDSPVKPAADGISAANGVNKVTVTIFGQEVTVEGRLSRQELQKLAESLTL